MEEQYFVLKFLKNCSFKESVDELKRYGVAPLNSNYLGFIHQHILWDLEGPEQFIERKPEFRKKNMLAIKIKEGTISGLTEIVVQDSSKLWKTLYQMRDENEDESVDVSNSEFYNLTQTLTS